MTKRGFLIDVGWQKDWRRPDGTAQAKLPKNKAKDKDKTATPQEKSEKARACEREILRRLSWAGVALAISLVLNMWAVKLGRGSYMHINIVLQGILLIGLPAFLLGLVLMCVGRDKYPHVFVAGYAMNLIGVITFLMLVSACIGLFIAASDTRAALAYCESLIPRLERHKEATGRYPETIEAVANRENEPLLLRGRQYYVPQADGYVLEFKRPQKSMEIIEYASWKGQWETRR